MTKRMIVLGLASWLLVVTHAAAEVDEAAFERARAAFIERMVSNHDFEPDALDAALAQAQVDARVLDLIARPAERVVPWHEYRNIFLTDARIEAGVDFWRRHEATLRSAAETHGVAPEVIVAILGVESFFGQRMGSYRVLDALVTLAFAYPPRSSFFTSELEHFLLLTREERVDPFDAFGSYAGAMGAAQFISSSYRAYAVDGSGNGRRDLWNDWDDITHSIANYFRVHGWRDGEPVAERAALADSWNGHRPANGLNLDQTVGSLRQLGYAFPAEVAETAPAAVYALEGEAGVTEYWVGFHNFYVITRYNRSHMYALAVHQLSQALSAAYAAAADEAASAGATQRGAES